MYVSHGINKPSSQRTENLYCIANVIAYLFLTKVQKVFFILYFILYINITRLPLHQERAVLDAHGTTRSYLHQEGGSSRCCYDRCLLFQLLRQLAIVSAITTVGYCVTYYDRWLLFPLFLLAIKCANRCETHSNSESVEGRVKPLQYINIGVFNVRRCSTHVVKKGENAKMILRRRLDVCALSETKLMGIGKVVGRVSGVGRGGRGKGWPFY